jgi:hypothetical protein
MPSARSRKGTYALAALAAIAAPAVVTLLSITRLTGSHPLEFRPFLNDEVYYWHQTATAAVAGMQGGYYTLEEITARDGRFHFGPHGPLYPLLYGSIARLTGWHRASAPLFNLAWMMACALAFIVVARLSQPRVWLLALVLATCWPMSFWAASSMQESFHHGLAFLLAAALVAIGRHDRAAIVLVAIAVPLALLTRLSWGILVPGIVLLALRGGSARRMALGALASVAIVGAAVLVFGRIAPRMPAGFRFLQYSGFRDAAAQFERNIGENLRRLVDFSVNYDPLELVHRAEYLVLTAIVVTAAIVAVARARTRHSPETAQLLVQASNLGGIVAAMIAAYALTNWTEHRVISSHVLVAVLVFLTLPGRIGPGVAAAFAVANLAAAPIYMESFFETRKDNFIWDRRALRAFEETAAVHMRYDPALPPWCNTILSSQYPPDFVAVPPGIGISITRETDQMAWPPRSRYVLLDPPALAVIPGPLNARPLASLPYGTLYLNLDARCGD